MEQGWNNVGTRDSSTMQVCDSFFNADGVDDDGADDDGDDDDDDVGDDDDDHNGDHNFELCIPLLKNMGDKEHDDDDDDE